MFKNCPSQASYLKNLVIIAPIGKDFQYFFACPEANRLIVSFSLNHPACGIFLHKPLILYHDWFSFFRINDVYSAERFLYINSSACVPWQTG